MFRLPVIGCCAADVDVDEWVLTDAEEERVEDTYTEGEDSGA